MSKEADAEVHLTCQNCNVIVHEQASTPSDKKALYEKLTKPYTCPTCTAPTWCYDE